MNCHFCGNSLIKNKCVNCQNAEAKNLKKTKQKKTPILPRLVIIKGGTIGREFPLLLKTVNIGRWDPALGSIPEIDLSDEDLDARISRFHATISKKGNVYLIRDSGSRNGTILNNEFTLTPGIDYPLKKDDQISIGNLIFHFFRK